MKLMMPIVTILVRNPKIAYGMNMVGSGALSRTKDMRLQIPIPPVALASKSKAETARVRPWW